MIVMASVILAAVALAWFEVYGLLQESNRVAAHLEISKLTAVVARFQRRTGHPPRSLDELIPGDLLGFRPDPWGNAFIYRRSSEEFEVRSAGPDGVVGTDDDVTL